MNIVDESLMRGQGLGLLGPGFDAVVTEPTTRLQLAVFLGVPWPPRQGFIPVIYWPPQIAESEEEVTRKVGLRNFDSVEEEHLLDSIDLDGKPLVSNFVSHGRL